MLGTVLFITSARTLSERLSEQLGRTNHCRVYRSREAHDIIMCHKVQAIGQRFCFADTVKARTVPRSSKTVTNGVHYSTVSYTADF